MKKTPSRLQHLCFTFVMAALFAAGLPAHAQLDILLTNDDGFGEPGIEALKDRLRAAGHTVFIAAPDGNSSSASASLDLSRPFWQVECPEVENECKVRSVCIEGETLPENCTMLESLGPATPVASVAAGSAAVGKHPSDFDLTVSGINSGKNVGPELQFSGTVGTAIATISKIGANTPAIAVSTVRDPVNVTLEDVADFVVTVIAHLEDARKYSNDRLLPDGIGLNINYPDLAPDDVAGVKLTVQGRVLRVQNTNQVEVFRARPFLVDENVFIPERTTIFSDDTALAGADTTAFEEGFITITPIEADYTAKWRTRVRVERLLKGVLP